MDELNKHDLNWCVRKLPYKLRKTMKENELYIGGGFIRACIANEKPADIDLFMPEKELCKELAEDLNKGSKLIITDNAITVRDYKPVLQFVTRWIFQDPYEIINSFDFTICQAVIWWDHYCLKWKSLRSTDFYQDLAAKRLVYIAPKRHEDAGGSLLRVLKYYQKGYRITLDSFAGTIARLVKDIDFKWLKSIDDPDSINDEVETKMIIKGLLIEVDPQIDPDHILD